ncbi:MAG TPA: DNA translocase FtsK [Bacteroidetes bacterium]|nr:DNA translocase FtsK [Bacteroidota bacterium]
MARKKVTPESNVRQGPVLSPNRKVEIIGILVMVIAMLIAISIITYEEGDYSIISDTEISTVFQGDDVSVNRVRNGLGLVGAYISHAFVYLFFGYLSIVVAIIGFQYGWAIFRHSPLAKLQWPSFLWFSGMALFATIIGWINIQFDLNLDNFFGVAGLALAQLMLTITGMYGSAILLGAFLIILILLLIDRDIQLTIDRIRDAVASFRDWMDQKKSDRKIAREKAAEQKAIQAEEAARLKLDEESKRPNLTSANTISNANDAGHQPNTSNRGIQPLERKRYVIADESKPADAVKPPDLSDEGNSEKNSPLPISAERERWIKEQAEMKEKIMPDRALMEKEEDKVRNAGYEDEIQIKVYVGEEEEAAKARDLEREQRAQSIPVIKYQFPTIDLLDNPPLEGNEIDFDEIEENKKTIISKLKMHGIEILTVEAIVGPTVTLYELQPAPDVKISKIESYANDLKMAMATRGLRIIAPIPGKSAVGIEVPNRKRQTVYIKQLINTRKFVESKMALPVAFGKTIENEVYMVDLTAMPHLLIAGATGSGKSVGINTIITCLLYKCHPENLKFVLIDPKKIELSLYRYLQKHFIATLPDADEPIITDTAKVMETLTSVTKEMDDRYDLLKMGMVRDIRSYNDKFKEGKLEDDLGHRHLPYIVVIIDELADLMLTAGKAIEEPIARIAQLARAVGIHLVVATQRPSVNVITGTIKANFPVRIAYQVASKIDSRTILDTMGADQLVGKGDMLVSTSGSMIRVQNAFVSTEEVERINAFIGNQLGYNKPYFLPKVEDPNARDSGIPELDDRDDLFEEAAKVVVLHQQGSVSLIQRKLKLGYNRAGRIIDQLYAAGVVGPYQGSTARDVLIADEDELLEHLRDLDA